MLSTTIEPLIKEFQKADGRGTTTIANQTLMKIIRMLVDYIDHPPISYATVPAYAPPVNPPFSYAAVQAYAPVATNPWPMIDHPDWASAVSSVLNNKIEQHPLNAVEQLHNANFLLDPDYTAIKEHIAKEPAISDPPVKIRKKPGRKPKIRPVTP